MFLERERLLYYRFSVDKPSVMRKLEVTGAMITWNMVYPMLMKELGAYKTKMHPHKDEILTVKLFELIGYTTEPDMKQLSARDVIKECQVVLIKRVPVYPIPPKIVCKLRDKQKNTPDTASSPTLDNYKTEQIISVRRDSADPVRLTSKVDPTTSENKTRSIIAKYMYSTKFARRNHETLQEIYDPAEYLDLPFVIDFGPSQQWRSNTFVHKMDESE